MLLRRWGMKVRNVRSLVLRHRANLLVCCTVTASADNVVPILVGAARRLVDH